MMFLCLKCTLIKAWDFTPVLLSVVTGQPIKTFHCLEPVSKWSSLVNTSQDNLEYNPGCVSYT